MSNRLISPTIQAMSKVSNTFNNSFPPDCQKASVPIQFHILCSLLIDECDPQKKGFSESSKTIAQLAMYQYRKMTSNYDQSHRCEDMLRREKHLYQFMLV